MHDVLGLQVLGAKLWRQGCHRGAALRLHPGRQTRRRWRHVSGWQNLHADVSHAAACQRHMSPPVEHAKEDVTRAIMSHSKSRIQSQPQFVTLMCRCVIRGCVPKKLLVYGCVCHRRTH